MVNPIRVVVAENHDNMLKVVSDLLRENFYVVGVVTNGLDLFQAARTLLPDVIVSGIEMPGQSGLDAMSALKRMGMEIPFVIISTDTKAASYCLERGATGYVHDYDIFGDLTEAVLFALRGTRFISRSVVR
jgi:DNA-binding NarL/FixJ family response regulator